MNEQKKSHQSGNLEGYRPEYKDIQTDKWRRIEFKINYHPRGATLNGIPFPLMFGGILSEVWLCGKAQAQALAWGFAADYEAIHPGPIEVRIVPYKINYKIEYEPTEEEMTPTHSPIAEPQI